MILRLIRSNFATRKTRFALTVAAVALSVSLVVSVTGGFATIMAVADNFLSQIMGSVDARVQRESDRHAGVDASLLPLLAADPQVRSASPRLETNATLLDAGGTPLLGRSVQVVGVVMPGDSEAERLNVNAGQWFRGADGDAVMIDQVVAETLKLKVGGTLTLPGVRQPLKLKVTGIVQKPGILAAQIQTIYLPLHTLQRYAMPDEPGRVGKIQIRFKPGVNSHEFADRWQAKLSAIDPSLTIKLTSSYRDDLNRNLQGVQIMGYFGSMVAMLAATFIVFSSLAMGVTERQRTLAMLRAVGASRGQIGWLVIVEGVFIALVGVAIGIPLGWAWLEILVHVPRFVALFSHIPITLSWGGLALAAGGSIGAAVLASLLPAFNATRVDPLDAMRPLANASPGRVPVGLTLIGLLLIGVDPLVLFGPLPREGRFYGHFLAGTPALFIGFFLLSPLFVWAIERIFGPIVAVVMRVRGPLLRQQLSSGIWRAAGTAAALMVGLAVLIVLQVQGHSALDSWKLPDHFPDVFIFSPVPLNPADQEKLAHVQGIRAGQLMPIAIASPQFGSNLFAIAGAMVMPDATMFFGVDPDQSMQMMELEFRDDQGNRVSKSEQDRMAAQATAELKLGRHVIVTDEFRQLRGLKRGDTIPLKTIHGVVNYTIAGIVWSPGMDVINSKFDLGRQFEQRTAASLFGSLADARNDFNVKDIYLFAANLDYSVERDQELGRIETALGKMNVTIGDVRQIKAGMQSGLSNLLLLVSTVAFAAMGLASLGVTNTILASVRSRQWQFGILRSIGVTRGQLLRLVIAEALLLGLVGAGLGLAAGMEMSLDAHQLTLITLGLKTVLVVPWPIVWIGVGVVLTISFMASTVPAIQVARADPLSLLQAGRSAG